MTDFEAVASNWLQASSDALRQARFVQADYDELAPGRRIATAMEGIHLFKALVAKIADAHMDLIPLLVLPLAASARLRATPPDLGRFLRARWTNLELPGYYLTTHTLWSAWDDVEEYRLPVDGGVEELEGLVCYYRVSRDRRSRDRRWEYERGFYIRTA